MSAIGDAAAQGKIGIPLLAETGFKAYAGGKIGGNVDISENSSWGQNITKAYNDTIRDSNNHSYDNTMQFLKEQMTSTREGTTDTASMAKAFSDALGSEDVQRLAENYNSAKNASDSWRMDNRDAAATTVSAGALYSGFGRYDLQSVESDILHSGNEALINTYNNSKRKYGDIKAGLVETIGVLQSTESRSLGELLKITANNEGSDSYIAQDVYASYLRQQGISETVRAGSSSIRNDVHSSMGGMGNHVDHTSSVIQNMIEKKRTAVQKKIDNSNIGGSPNYPDFQNTFNIESRDLRDIAEGLHDEKFIRGTDQIDKESAVHYDDSLGDASVNHVGDIVRNQGKNLKNLSNRILKR